MKLKKYRLNKKIIYVSKANSLEHNARMAALFGYPFIKHNDKYYEVSIKQYMTKPDVVIVQMIDVEIVEHELKGEIEVGN